MPPVTVQQALELALQHHQAGRLAEAEALYRQILSVQPNQPDALHLVGVIAHQVGRHDAAVEWIGRAIVINPDNPALYLNLGEAHRAAGRPAEAIVAYRHSLHLHPNQPEAYSNLGNALRNQGRLDDAIGACRRALELRSDYAEAYVNLGSALVEQRQMMEAIAAFRRAIEISPDNALAHYNLGIALAESGEGDEAIGAYCRAVELKPDFAQSHNNLGVALARQGRLDEAAAAYRCALKCQLEYAEAHNNLGNVLKDQGRLDESIEVYRRAIGLQPTSPQFHSNLILALHLHPHQDSRLIAEAQRRWNHEFSVPVPGLIRPHPNGREPERRLRIGYLSPDFCDHVVGWNIRPLFQHHDKGRFEVFCYSGVQRQDHMTKWFRQCAEKLRTTLGVADEALAEIIREDQIDILVDLSQHADGNRLPVFARKPAPIAVSFAGYPASSGVEALEYRISDRYLESDIDSPGTCWKDGFALFAEGSKVGATERERVAIVDSFWCYDPGGMDLAVNELPAKQGGHVTFGSLNNFCKVNDSVLRLWARILWTVKNSRLILLSSPGSHQQWTREFLSREGIEGHRVEFVERRSRQAYLALHDRLDVGLDPFPYGGHTTSLDALWMGVPVVSLAGKTSVSRAGLSILSNLGLSELVAHTEDEYVRIAAQLAHDMPRLAELRATLRARMEASVLMDAPRFARNIEAAYRAMWRRWCGQDCGRR